VLSIFWRRCTTAGVVSSMLVGTAATLTLIYLSPTIQVDILKHDTAVFPLRNPALITMPLAFLTATVVSLLTSNAGEQAGYSRVETQMHVGH
jgi:cation/acetate symporter